MNETFCSRISEAQKVFQKMTIMQSPEELTNQKRYEPQLRRGMQDTCFTVESIKPTFRKSDEKNYKKSTSLDNKDNEKTLPRKPLNIAVLNGKMKTVLELLGSGEDPLEKDGHYGNTGIHWAVKADNIEILELYRERGFDLSLTNNRGWNPLHIAAEGSRCKSLVWLLKNGADVEAKDDLKQTPLAKAAFKGHLTAAKILLSYGASPNCKNARASPLNSAVKGGHVEVVKLFLEHGADLKQIDNWGRNLLHVAKNVELLEWLIDNNLDINRKDDWGRTPLHDAVQASNLQNAAFLLAKGADIEARDQWGYTPLYEAAKTGKTELVRLLLEKGANPGCTAKDGSIPSEVTNDKTIKEMLLKRLSNL